MRTITEAYNEIKAQDENTALTLFALKTLVKSGVIPSVKIGNNKQLVNMAVLSQYLEGNTAPQAKIIPYGVRKVVSR